MIRNTAGKWVSKMFRKTLDSRTYNLERIYTLKNFLLYITLHKNISHWSFINGKWFRSLFTTKIFSDELKRKPAHSSSSARHILSSIMKVYRPPFQYKLIHDRAPLYHSNVSFKRPASDRTDYIATNAYWWNFLARNWHAWLLARISTLRSVENLKQSSKSIVSSIDTEIRFLVAEK